MYTLASRIPSFGSSNIGVTKEGFNFLPPMRARSAPVALTLMRCKSGAARTWDAPGTSGWIRRSEPTCRSVNMNVKNTVDYHLIAAVIENGMYF